MVTELLEVGVDWLTCSWDATMPPSVPAQVEHDFKLSTEGRPGRWLNYTGRTTMEAFFGSSSQSWLLRLSGGSAFSYWRNYVASAKHVSRLDIQITFRQNSYNPMLAKQMCQSASSVRVDTLNYPKIKLIDGCGDGDTFTLGDRSSDTYMRLYDKGAESGLDEYAQSWRLEIEYKAAKAKAVAALLLERGDDARTIIGLCLSHCHEHGLYPPIPPQGIPVRAPAIRREKDDERSLRWLETQVYKTVSRLIDNGRIEDVYSALGLRPVNARGWEKV